MTTKDYQTRRPLRIFLSYFRPHRGLFLLDISCAFLIAVIDLAFPLISRTAMYHWLPDKQFSIFFTVMALVVAAFVLRAGLYFIVGYWGHTFGILVEADIRRDLFAHMQDLGFDFYDKNRTGQLMSRLTTDLFELTELAHHGPEDLFISLVTIIGALAVMFSIQWRLAVVVCCIIPIFLLVVMYRRRQMSQASRAAKQKTGAINAEIESGLSGVRTTKAFANEAQQQRRFDGANEVFKTSKRNFHKEMGVPPGHGPVQRGDGVLPVHPLRGGDLRGRLPHHAGPDGHGGPHHLQPVYHHLHQPRPEAGKLRRDVLQRLCGPAPVHRADGHGAHHSGRPRRRGADAGAGPGGPGERALLL